MLAAVYGPFGPGVSVFQRLPLIQSVAYLCLDLFFFLPQSPSCATPVPAPLPRSAFSCIHVGRTDANGVGMRWVQSVPQYFEEMRGACAIVFCEGSCSHVVSRAPRYGAHVSTFEFMAWSSKILFISASSGSLVLLARHISERESLVSSRACGIGSSAKMH